MKKFGYGAILSLVLPLTAAAQGLSQGISNADSIVVFIKNLLNTILPLLIAAAVVYFVWGVFQIFLTDDDEKRKKAQKTILYGVIAIFVMVSVWGLVNILSNTFKLNNNTVENGNLQPIKIIPGTQ